MRKKRWGRLLIDGFGRGETLSRLVSGGIYGYEGCTDISIFLPLGLWLVGEISAVISLFQILVSSF